MERLTEKHYKKNGGYFMKCSEWCEREETMCMECERSDEVVDRLGAIEDILGDDYDLDRLRELVQADREGRCGIPPVKLHQHIFRVFNGKVLEETVCQVMWEPFMPGSRWKVWVMGNGLPYYWNDCIGKTVFLTREAAEDALKGEQDG